MNKYKVISSQGEGTEIMADYIRKDGSMVAFFIKRLFRGGEVVCFIKDPSSVTFISLVDK